jgi:hypothetical protein
MTVKGEHNPRAVLTEDTVRTLRNEYKEQRQKGRTQRQAILYLSAKYDTSQSNVYYIITRTTWREVT